MYQSIVYLHVLGAFAFVLAHGTSMFVAFRLRSRRDPAQIADLLELSGIATGLMYIGLGFLLIGGIWAGFAGGHWGRLWIWLAIAILVVVMMVMYAVAAPFYGRMRAAARIPGYADKTHAYDPPATSNDLARLKTSRRPEVLAAVGGIGLAAIVWLMVAKPM